VRRLLAILGATLLGCRETPRPSPEAPEASLAVGLSPLVPAVSPTPAPPTPSSPSTARCGWRWGPDTALRIEATGPVSDLVATCAGDALGVAWREGSRVRASTRALQPDATWADPVTVADDATRLGEPTAAGRDLWLAWETAGPPSTSGVRVAVVRNGVVVRSGPTVLGRGRVTHLHALHGIDDLALVAATLASREGPQTLLLRMSATGALPTGGALLSPGMAVASAPGTTAFLAVQRRAGAVEGGPWVAEGWHVDARLAAAFGQSPRPGVWGALPDGAARSRGTLALGPGGFAWSPRATDDGAVLVQTVLGAERGMARVAWWSEPPRLIALRVAPSGLSAVTTETAGRVRVEYWDEDHTLVAREVSPEGPEAPRALASPLPNAPAVLAVSYGTRSLRCNGLGWRLALVSAEEGQSPVLTADRADCDTPR